MSRIGKKPIAVPAGVTVEVSGNTLTAKGPKGSLSQEVLYNISVKVEGNEVILERPSESKKHKAMHGLFRSLVNNAIIGVSEGYKKELELVGVGYKASNKGNLLELNLGYSHNIYFQIPEELKLETEMKKGQNPLVTLEGTDKQLIGQVAAKIKSLRKVEPYKGKGIRFKGEVIRRKAGKTAK
ncbi:MAG: 50S ribosomal protein L6 [Flammeovirgaceae bacterium]